VSPHFLAGIFVYECGLTQCATGVTRTYRAMCLEHRTHTVYECGLTQCATGVTRTYRAMCLELSVPGALSGDFPTVEMNAIANERTLNNSCSQSLARKRDSQKLKSMFSKYFSSGSILLVC